MNRMSIAAALVAAGFAFSTIGASAQSLNGTVPTATPGPGEAHEVYLDGDDVMVRLDRAGAAEKITSYVVELCHSGENAMELNDGATPPVIYELALNRAKEKLTFGGKTIAFTCPPAPLELDETACVSNPSRSAAVWLRDMLPGFHQADAEEGHTPFPAAHMQKYLDFVCMTPPKPHYGTFLDRFAGRDVSKGYYAAAVGSDGQFHGWAQQIGGFGYTTMMDCDDACGSSHNFHHGHPKDIAKPKSARAKTPAATPKPAAAAPAAVVHSGDPYRVKTRCPSGNRC